MKKARKIVSIIVTLCFLLTLVPAGAFAAPKDTETPFDDVQTTDWFYDTVQYVYDEGLMAGTGDRIFSPQQTTTRGMIVTILHRMAGSPEAEGQDFTDVDPDAWYAPAINWSIESGVGAGYGGGLFGPDDAITREQMASFLYRYAELKEYDVSAVGDLNDFADASAVSDWAEDVMSWAVGADLFAGRDNNQLAPQGLTTRAEAATILMRYCENIVGTSAEDPSDEPSDEPDNPDVDDPSEDNPSVDPTPDDPDEPSTEPDNPSTEPEGPDDVEEPFESFEEAYNDFIDQKPSDFEEDRVLQFDENDAEDNFAVVSDDVVIVKDNDKDNQLAASQEDGTYTVTNITAQITTLEDGSKLLMIGNTPEESVAIVIEDIVVSGTTAVIRATDAELTDFFEYIQIDKEMIIDRAYLDTSGASEGISYKGTLDETTCAGTVEELLKQRLYAEDTLPKEGENIDNEDDDMIDIDQNLSATHAFSVNYTGDTAEIVGDVAVQIAVDIVVNWGPEWFGEDYIRCDLTSSVRVDDDLTLKVKAEDEIPFVLGEIILPVGTTGFFIEGTIFIKVKYAGSVEGTFSSTLQKRYGFTFNSDEGYQKIDESSISDVSALIDTEVSASAGAGAGLSVSFVELITASLDGEVGMKAEAAVDPTSSSNDHNCYLCIDGKLSRYGTIGFSIRIGIESLSITPIKLDLLDSEKVYSNFYCSLYGSNSTLQFGLGNCPNKKGTGEIEPDDPSAGEVEFAGGTGTKEDPYLVVNAEQFNAVRKNFNVYYKQMADINLAGYSNWEPINYDGQYWLGYGGYDGNDYLISNLTITEIPQGDRVGIGLFGEVAGKTIKNVNLKDVV